METRIETIEDRLAGTASGDPVLKRPASAVLGKPSDRSSVNGTCLSERVNDAELLLDYAAELGIGVEENVRDNVLKARIACDAGQMTSEIEADLLTALSSLAVNVKSLTLPSLPAWLKPENKGVRRTLRLYGISAFVVGLLVFFISLITFFI